MTIQDILINRKIFISIFIIALIASIILPLAGGVRKIMLQNKKMKYRKQQYIRTK